MSTFNSENKKLQLKKNHNSNSINKKTPVELVVFLFFFIFLNGFRKDDEEHTQKVDGWSKIMSDWSYNVTDVVAYCLNRLRHMRTVRAILSVCSLFFVGGFGHHTSTKTVKR